MYIATMYMYMLGVLCCFALIVVCLTLLASSFLLSSHKLVHIHCIASLESVDIPPYSLTYMYMYIHVPLVANSAESVLLAGQ